MICHLCERALFMHAHGELSGPQRLLLQCHLEGCDGCRARWAKSVVEKDQLRRALSPVPTLDSEGERRLQIIGARIRMEQRPGSPAVNVPAGPPAMAPAAGRGRRVAGLMLASALLAIALTAMAAAWVPALTGASIPGTPSRVPLGACFAGYPCANCGKSHVAVPPAPEASALQPASPAGLAAPAPAGCGAMAGAANSTPAAQAVSPPAGPPCAHPVNDPAAGTPGGAPAPHPAASPGAPVGER